MAFVHSFTFRPLARQDEPWTTVRIEESPDKVVWTPIDTQVLDPLDLDPASPQARSMTTDNATLAEGWFRAVFVDAGLDEAPPSAAVYSPGGTEGYTAADVRVWSNLDFEEWGYPEEADDPLQPVVDEAVAYVQLVTGRTLDDTLPVDLIPLARAAVRMRTEQLVLGLQSSSVEETMEAIGAAGVQSFSVPGYSETRFSPSIEETRKWINTWPALHDVLRLLMTPEKLEEWLALVDGRYAPAFAVTEVDWSDDLPTTPIDPYDW